MAEIVPRMMEANPESQASVKSYLARDLGFPGVLIYALSGIGLCYVGTFPFSMIAGLYPGSSLIGILLVMFVMSAVLTGVYSAIGAIIPRYGADYRLASRVINPPLAFASSLTFVVMLSLISGSLVASIFQETVPGFIKILSIITFDKTLINQAAVVSAPYAVTLSGTIFIILVFLLLILPPRMTHRVLMIGFILTLLAWGLICIQLASANSNGFPAAWNRFMGDGNFSQPLEEARQLGMQGDSSLKTTIIAGLLFSFGLFSGFLNSVNIAAEIKEPQKNLTRGNFAALVVCVGVIMISVLLLRRLVPIKWISAESFLYLSKEYGGQAMPWIQLYGAVLQPNPAVSWLVGIFWMFGVLNMAHTFLYSSSRVILAWVGDRLLPERIGFLHPTLKSPLIPVLLVCILAEVGMIMASLNSIFAPFSTIYLMTFLLILPILAVTLLPYRKKSWFQSAPAFVQWHIGPFPILTVLGCLSLIYLVGTIVAFFAMNRLIGVDLQVVIVFSIVFLSGLLWYYIRRNSLLVQGENIDRLFEDLTDEIKTSQKHR